MWATGVSRLTREAEHAQEDPQRAAAGVVFVDEVLFDAALENVEQEVHRQLVTLRRGTCTERAASATRPSAGGRRRSSP